MEVPLAAMWKTGCGGKNGLEEATAIWRKGEMAAPVGIGEEGRPERFGRSCLAGQGERGVEEAPQKDVGGPPIPETRQAASLHQQFPCGQGRSDRE